MPHSVLCLQKKVTLGHYIKESISDKPIASMYLTKNLGFFFYRLFLLMYIGVLTACMSL